ncbi:MAG TPA: hypothetical protein VIK08_00350 [Candidatus Limnocylindrales bacterium]
MPVAGLAAGVTYPRRRNVAGGGGRLPIIAALFLALAGLVVGALLVGLAGRPGPTLVAGASGTPVSSLPIFTQETPTPGPATPTPPQSFPSLPTPPPSVLPTDTPLFTPPPSETPTPTPTATPTKKPTPPPTPTPTPTPVALTCAHATGTPTNNLTVGYGNKPSRVSKGWCLDYVVFHVVTTVPPGSTYGNSRLLLNGKTIASFTCAQSGTPCQNDVQVQLNQKLAKVGASVSYDSTCVGDTADPAGTCANPGYNATATFHYEPATP